MSAFPALVARTGATELYELPYSSESAPEIYTQHRIYGGELDTRYVTAKSWIYRRNVHGCHCFSMAGRLVGARSRIDDVYPIYDISSIPHDRFICGWFGWNNHLGGGMAVSGDDWIKYVPAGLSVTVTTSPKPQYSFNGWYKNDTLVTTALSLHVHHYHVHLVTLEPRFTLDKYELVVTGGTSTPAAGWVSANTAVVFLAYCTGNKAFVRWTLSRRLLERQQMQHCWNLPASKVTAVATYRTAVFNLTVVPPAGGSVVAYRSLTHNWKSIDVVLSGQLQLPLYFQTSWRGYQCQGSCKHTILSQLDVLGRDGAELSMPRPMSR